MIGASDKKIAMERIIIKIGGSLFYQDEACVSGVMEGIWSLSNYYQVYLIVGSGPLGEFYKAKRKELGINSDNRYQPNYLDDKEVWRHIQAINLRLLGFKLELCSPVIHPRVFETGDAQTLRSAEDRICMIIPSDATLASEWEQCRSSAHEEYGIFFPWINIQKSDIKAILYGRIIGVERFLILTDVEGVYPSDPKTNSKVRRISHLTSSELRNMEFGLGGYKEMKTCLDKGISVILQGCMPSTAEVAVLSYDSFLSNISNTGHLNFQ